MPDNVPDKAELKKAQEHVMQAIGIMRQCKLDWNQQELGHFVVVALEMVDDMLLSLLGLPLKCLVASEDYCPECHHCNEEE